MTRTEFYSHWLKHFAKGISPEDIEKYVVSTGNYIWHVFSWKLLDEKEYLVGDNARKEYNKIQKDHAVYVEWLEDDMPKPLTPDLFYAEALDKMTEVYVVASDFSWTYIKTHENDLCGPYFMRAV